MYSKSARPNMKPDAPVNGGMRWRSAYHDLVDFSRRHGGFDVNDPDAPVRGRPYRNEAGMAEGIIITGTPPPEARVGGEYIHQPRAYDAQVSGFTWYFEKSPSGMAVERHTGRVTWTPTEGGYAEVVLCARSVHGTTGRLCWTICVRKAPAARAYVANPRFLAALRRKRIHNTDHAPAAESRPRAGKSFRPGPFLLCGEKRRTGPALRAPPPLEERSRVAVPLRI